MLSTLRNSTRSAVRAARTTPTVPLRTAATSAQKREGDISDAFASLSGLEAKPLEPKYAALKGRLIKGREDAVRDSWERLLRQLREQVPMIEELKSKAIPEIDFRDLDNPSTQFRDQYKKTGVAVVRNVVPEQEVLQWKKDIQDYVRQNPHTKAFPPDNPQVFELYWSPSQIRARAHPNLLKAQRFLMSYWHSLDPSAVISTQHPAIYADRLRIRQPGDAKFALGPHVDNGSIERWEEEGYGKGKVFDAIWEGKWEQFDPWEASCRLPVNSDMYQGVGACSMFRMAQGWLSMSNTGPMEGTLLVNPMLQLATAYYLLRPFFSAKRQAEDPEFLSSDNWKMDREQTSWVQGAMPGRGQDLNAVLHPHLELEKTMVHVPRVRPGDYVAWHSDTIHAVDRVHGGKSDSSVLYIPACPLTELNAQYLARQRESFLKGIPAPDFGGGVGESRHVGRPTVDDVAKVAGPEGMRAFGLKEWDSSEPSLTQGQREVLDRANKILGFYM